MPGGVVVESVCSKSGTAHPSESVHKMTYHLSSNGVQQFFSKQAGLVQIVMLYMNISECSPSRYANERSYRFLSRSSSKVT